MTGTVDRITTTEPTDLAPAMDRLFDIDIVERDEPITTIEGTIPPYVRGSYYLAGPSRFKVGDVSYRHWLDGDGTATRLNFSSSGVHLTHRFVHTTKFSQELEDGRALFRTFGTSFEGDCLKMGIGLESPANVSVFRFRDQLLAFGEQGLPFALDPETLETRGVHTFDGRLNQVSPLSAHPCFTTEGGDLLNFGVSFSPRQPSLTLYRFSAADGGLVYRRRHPLPYPCSIHDFIISDRLAIFFLSPYLLDVGAMLADGKSVMEALSWCPEKGSELLILDLERGDPVARIPAGDKYCLHLINAFDRPFNEPSDEPSEARPKQVTVDLFELDRPVYDQYQPLPDLFADAPAGRPRRFVIDLDRQEIVENKVLDYPLCADFPAIDPRLSHRPYDDFWMLGISKTGRAGRKFFDRLERLSWSGAASHWQAPEGTYLGGEPVFVPDLATDGAGCVLCQAFDALRGKGEFLLFEAHRVENGPCARLSLDHPIPLGFHASYYPDEILSPDSHS